MDSLVDIKNFSVLESTLTDSEVRKNIRLLCVFGCNGEEVTFITKEDEVYCYGRNRFGGLGLGTYEENIKSPQINDTLSGLKLVNIFCGFEHWSALTADGRCFTWGKNDFGQLGIGSIEPTATPKCVEGLSQERIIEISCGATHTLALTVEGEVYSWGSNKSGQLGTGFKGFLASPRKIPMKEQVVAISSGKNHCVALSIIGKAYFWGLNNYGQLGQILKNGMISYYPRLINYIYDTFFLKAICGPNYSLLLSSDGDVYSFGDNSCGQIGNGAMDNQFMPFKVNTDVRVKDIIAHKENDVSIAVSVNNKYYIWGLAKNRRYLKPKEVTDTEGLSVFDVYAKYAKTKLTFKTIVIDEELQGWEQFNIKDKPMLRSDQSKARVDSRVDPPNRRSPSNLPRNMKILDNVLDIKNFPILYSTLTDRRVRNSIRLLRIFGIKGCKVMFVTNADRVYAYGLNRDGSLGLGTYEEHIRKPQLNEVLSGKEIVDIAPGFEHCIVLTANGHCYSMGCNRYGQLGLGNTDNQCTPQLIEDLTDVKVVQIQCGAYHSMALTSEGEVFSWGHNTFAQLGDRTYNSREIPTQVLISEKVVSISNGSNHSLALTENGQVYVWGNNSFGQLGRHPSKDIQKDRLKPMSNRPRAIPDLSNIKKAICGPNHVLLLTSDGFVYAFGLNTDGQIGNGTVDNQYEPLRLNNNNNIRIKDIIAFYDSHISIAISDTNYCFVWGLVWGQNRVLKPKVIPESAEELMDIFGIYSTNKTMFKTVVVNELFQIKRCSLKCEEPKDLILNTLNCVNQSPHFKVKTFEELLDIKLFPILCDFVVKDITLLYVFGKNGSNVIFATNEDKVYVFGDNTDGCLALGTTDIIRSPTLNEGLSNNQLIDIQNGFKHCLALTACGQCFSWGQNRFGQLGDGTFNASNYPKIIEGLRDKKVIQICCGAFHSMALTTDGQVFSWGQNILGQLGISTYRNSPTPTLIEMKHPIIWISCGRNHSSAVGDVGLAYTWGHNEFGQLGRERQFDYRPARKQWIAFRPFFNSYFKNITFVKAVCGPNYTLLLTDEGFIYAFGDNTNGQIGIGTEDKEPQFKPIRVVEDIRFKDIICNFQNDLSIGISTDGQYFVWGLVNYKKILSPKLVSESGQESIFNIYAKYGAKKITFKAITISKETIKDIKDSDNKITEYKFDKNVFLSELARYESLGKASGSNLNNAKFWNKSPLKRTISSMESSINDLKSRKNVFNNSNDSGFNLDKYFADYNFMENECSNSCSTCYKNLQMSPNLSNICILYEKAINEDLIDLENNCIEFAAKNWKNVITSKEFLTMNDSMSKRLMISVGQSSFC